MSLTDTQTSAPAGADAGDAAITAREAEVIGKPLRVVPLPIEEFGDDAKAFISAVNASFGASDAPATVSELYRVMFRHFPLFSAQMNLITFLLTEAEMPARDRELIILRILWLGQAPNPWSAHVDMAKSVGFTSEEIERVTQGSAAPGWTDHERAVLKGVEEVFATYTLSDETWETLGRTWTDRQLMEFPVVVGQYLASAINHNVLRTRLSAGSKGLRQR